MNSRNPSDTELNRKFPGQLNRDEDGPVFRVVGLYHMLLRRSLEHFFPDGLLEIATDGGVSSPLQIPMEKLFEVRDDPDGLSIEIHWFGSHYVFHSGNPTPFHPTERRLVEVIVRALDLRFRGLFDSDISSRLERLHFQTEDVIVADYLNTVDHTRVPIALEALRAAALSTYENRRVSLGVLLLGTDVDPAAPGLDNSAGAPRFNARLTAFKGFHRLCDGVKTLFLIDRKGDLIRLIGIESWAQAAQGSDPLDIPCPRPYVSHAKATRSGGHVCIVLTPSQEIKIFANGTLAFSYSDARWRLLDIPAKYAAWKASLSNASTPDLAECLFQAALNLSESRKGALFVVLRNPAETASKLIAATDRIYDEVVADDPEDPENLSPRKTKHALHHVVRGMHLSDIEPAILETIASLDGAVVVDLDGRLLTFGAILRIAPEALEFDRAVQGARTLAGLAASQFGPVLRVSEDGYLTMFLSGRRVWEM
jgi:hypothetical protein